MVASVLRGLRGGAACLLTTLGLAQAPGAVAGSDLSVGVYGRISPGPDGPPPVLNPRPLQVRQRGPSPQANVLYLYVPHSEMRHWAQHCARHHACAAQVYFVDAHRWLQQRQAGLPASAHPAAATTPSAELSEGSPSAASQGAAD